MLDRGMAGLPPPVRDVLGVFRARVSELLGDRLVLMRLFGSYARGDDTEESDLDVLVVVDRLEFTDKLRILDLAGDLFVESGRLISPSVFDRELYERHRRQQRPLVRIAEREGIPL